MVFAKCEYILSETYRDENILLNCYSMAYCEYFKHCKILYAGSYGVIWQMLRHLHISVLRIIAVTHDVLGGCNKILLHNFKRFRRRLDTCFVTETTAAVFLKKTKQKKTPEGLHGA